MLLQRDQQWLSLLAMKQLKNIGVFLVRNWHWQDVLTWHDIKKKLGYIGYVYSITKMTLDGKRQIRLSTLSKLITGNAFRLQWYQNHWNFHCYQQI
jgi:hypothetical protein